MQRQPDHFYLKLTVAVIATVVVVAASCCLGSSHISLREVICYLSGMKDELSPTAVTIIGKVRIPRVLTAALCGGALASVGCVMQGVFRNPMADPSVLGISSGSALGAAIAIVSGLNIVIIGDGFTGSYIGAVIGAAVTWILIFTIARGSGEYDTSSTLLAGIAISSIMSAFITVLMTLHMDSMERVYMWMLGTFSASTTSIWVSPQIDVLKLGKEAALSVGVRQSRTLGAVLCLSSILLAFCVANSGIIGFAGLIIPHIVSFFKVYRARRKLILCFFVGACFMVLCDSVAKTIVAPGEMAIGAITSLIGAPYFLWLLAVSRVRAGRKGIKL